MSKANTAGRLVASGKGYAKRSQSTALSFGATSQSGYDPSYRYPSLLYFGVLLAPGLDPVKRALPLPFEVVLARAAGVDRNGWLGSQPLPDVGFVSAEADQLGFFFRLHRQIRGMGEVFFTTAAFFFVRVSWRLTGLSKPTLHMWIFAAPLLYTSEVREDAS